MTNYAPNFPTVIDVRNFGAKGNGATDDTAAIQAAINAVGTTFSGPGGEVVFPPGNYLVSSELTVTGVGITLRGIGFPRSANAGASLKATAAMRSVLNIAASADNRVKDLFIDANRNAKYGVYRNGDTFCEYDHITVQNALLDGWHAASIPDGNTQSPVSHTGTGTSVATVTSPGNACILNGTITVTVASSGTHTPASGLVQLTSTLSGATVFNLATNGKIQFPLSSSQSESGLVWSFTTSGTCVNGDTYQVTVACGHDINDGARLNCCRSICNGTLYGTTAALALWTPLINGAPLTTSTVAGTISTTSGSHTITGSGTSFFSTSARAGDFIKVGAFPDWVANTAHALGDYIQISPSFGTGGGYAYIWKVTARTGDFETGSSIPTFPKPLNLLPTQVMVGQTVVDNHVTWTCISPAIFQIQCVVDDQTIIVNTNGAPADNFSGVDYAIGVGSGYYDESSGDNNTTKFEMGYWHGNGAAGIFIQQDFGCVLDMTQVELNAFAGVSINLEAAGVNQNVTFLKPYFESNWITDVYISYCSDFIIIEPTSINQVPWMSTGNPTTFGSIRGSFGATAAWSDYPIGASTYSVIPIITSSKLQALTIPSPIIKPWTSIQGVSAGTPIDISGPGAHWGSTIAIQAASPFITPLNSGLTLSNNGGVGGTASPVGQELTLINVGNYPIVLYNGYATYGLTLSAVTVSLGFYDTIDLVYDGTAWIQKGQVTHTIGRSITSATVMTTTNASNGIQNGMNSGVGIYGLTILEVTAPTGAFQISGVYPTGNFAGSGYGPAEDGQKLRIINFTTQSMTIKHEDSSDETVAINRIWCPGSIDLVISDASSLYTFVDLHYATSQSRWIVVDHS